MSQKILKILLGRFIKSNFKPQKQISAEEILYPKEVYPIYLNVQSTFKHCLQNKQINRPELLQFKKLINESIPKDQSKLYKDIKYKNDAHEIYSKLKCKLITKSQMKKLSNYINQFNVDIP